MKFSDRTFRQFFSVFGTTWELKTELVQALQREGETDVDEDMSLGYVIELVYDQLGNSNVFEHGTGIYKVKE